MVIRVKAHRIEEGDTLESVASKYGTTVPMVKSLSSIRNEFIGPVGDTVLVPKNEE